MNVRVAVVDNNDSFSHNLEGYLGEFADVTVGRFDEPPEADGYVFSPGPGKPDEFPIMYEILRDRDEPVLGVCLGHQAVAEFFGGSIGYADEVVHGKRSEIEHDRRGVFEGIESPTRVARYHSLVVDDVPEPVEVTARGADEVMGVRHTDRPVFGVQFHPESFLTDEGRRMVRNFVRIVEGHA
ncbi:aminodeoxychorismate/anthranilate synthase component II [Haladaptatus sp. F3-133]|jgi:anthranilate synthase/aminodeoxychorismate synthase-like glutamine amidotransferase|uniref:Aminodeoxychorismate/anthranilate synthase component II n=1 Tax=Halorutilus salinus TaxID=2487751 RepID=A0A9Q4GGN3_9EURY|nr:aminodeoxychorismate/anthranilate synthase component II [Halorutilus salinus]MCX2819334.1 aminodeoxychorismate/anthranilate synthase component II [Halorutilus salinus]